MGDSDYISRETEETVSNENAFMEYLYQNHGISCHKMPPNFVLDFFMTGKGLNSGRAVAEFKQRKMSLINQYDQRGGIFVNEKKISKMKIWKDLYDVSGYIFVGLTNGNYYKCKVDNISFKNFDLSVSDNLYGGLNNGGERDRQLTFTIPSHNFDPL